MSDYELGLVIKKMRKQNTQENYALEGVAARTKEPIERISRVAGRLTIHGLNSLAK